MLRTLVDTAPCLLLDVIFYIFFFSFDYYCTRAMCVFLGFNHRMYVTPLYRRFTATGVHSLARALSADCLSALPGDAALRAANAGGGGASSSRALAKLHSDLMSQFLKLLVPYVQGLTEAVERGGVSWTLRLICSPPGTSACFRYWRRVLHRL